MMAAYATYRPMLGLGHQSYTPWNATNEATKVLRDAQRVDGEPLAVVVHQHPDEGRCEWQRRRKQRHVTITGPELRQRRERPRFLSPRARGTQLLYPS